MTSPIQILGLWIEIPLEAQMSVFIVMFVRSGLAKG